MLKEIQEIFNEKAVNINVCVLWAPMVCLDTEGSSLLNKFIALFSSFYTKIVKSQINTGISGLCETRE